MIVNEQNVSRFFRGLQRNFEGALAGDSSIDGLWREVATRVPSTTETEDYTWMGEIEELRRWIGDRQITQLSVSKYAISNEEFERTYEVPTQKLEDDRQGIFSVQSASLGRAAAKWPNKLTLSEALAQGHTATYGTCHDGQNFFDTAHPVGNAAGDTYSNYTAAGGGEAWYLMDTTKTLKPIIFQERQAPRFWAMTDPQSHMALFDRKFLYGADARGAAGYGLPQTAYRHHGAIDETNFKTVRAVMRAYKNEVDQNLGINPNVIVVGASREDEAKKLFGQAQLASGESNYLFGAVRVIVVPFLP